jgi:osmotically-inducible protein OsmY
MPSIDVPAGTSVATVGDGTVILKGKVGSWTELSEGKRVARAAAGVTEVDNRLIVRA